MNDSLIFLQIVLNKYEVTEITVGFKEPYNSDNIIITILAIFIPLIFS